MTDFSRIKLSHVGLIRLTLGTDSTVPFRVSLHGDEFNLILLGLAGIFREFLLILESVFMRLKSVNILGKIRLSTDFAPSNEMRRCVFKQIRYTVNNSEDILEKQKHLVYL